MNDYLFNFAMAGVDALACWLVLRPLPTGVPLRLWRRLLASVCLLGGVMFPLAVGLGDDPFGMMRLGCWGLFAHVPAWGLATSIGVWRFSRPWSALGLFLTAIFIGVGVDAFLIEPTWLEVTHYKLRSDKLTRPLTIVVIADFQTDQIGDYERRVLAEVKAQQPDIILWAGDYLQEYREGHWELLRDALRDELEQIDLHPPLGSYAVKGNVDDDRWAEIFRDAPVEAFAKTETIERDDFAVTGLAMKASFRTDTVVEARDKFHIALGHCPSFALGDVQADLLVAGHIHGGQVRIPGIGPLLMARAKVPRGWATGVTPLTNGRMLAVSRGIGMERMNAPRLRFLCRPELMVLHVAPAKP